MSRLAFALAMLAATIAAAPSGLAQLDRFVGTWQSTGTFVASAYSKAGEATATTTCGWSTDRLFLICQQSVTLNGTPIHDVAIYTYDDATKTYHYYNVNVTRGDGAQIAVDGDTITYAGSFMDGSKRVLTRTLNVWVSPQRYTWRSEYSADDGKSWTLTASGVSTLVR